MQSLIIVYIVLAVLLAVLIAVFHYYKNLKNKEKVSYLLTFLRFVSLLALFLLFINPKIEQQEIEIVKPKLVIAVDNSKSIAYLKQSEKVINLVDEIHLNSLLNEKFDIDFYSFDNEVSFLDSLTFKGSKTDISKPFKQFKSIYKDAIAPILLISDGNQNIGTSFEFEESKQPIFSVVVGDTIKYDDIQITQLNVNRYAYLKNKFPVEVYIHYEGEENVEPRFSIFRGNQKIYSEKLNLSKDKNSQRLSFYLPTDKVGIHYYTAQVDKLSSEKNSINNIKNFVIEVIDEQSKTLLLTSFLHPDIGSLKESIESNKQRSVEIKVIGDAYNLEDYNSVLLYQPTHLFKAVFEQIKIKKLNYGIITGSKTDWNFLNGIQSNFSKKVIKQTENYQAVYNPSFGTFSQDNIEFESFPPLLDQFGTVSFSVPFETLLWQQVGSFITQSPLLATFEVQDVRTMVLFGENSWRWRMTSKIENQSFDAYDNFIAKIMQYLSSSKRVNRLTVDAESLYFSNDEIRIDASYMNKNYQFDPNATLWVTVKNKQTKTESRLPLSLVGNRYSLILSNLLEGEYSFIVSVENQNLVKRGNFKVVNFDAENQFLGANLTKLTLLSTQSGGTVFYLNNTNQMFKELIEDTRFLSIQKSHKKINSLVDWKWLLALIILSLSIEWFIRKYKGLI